MAAKITCQICGSECHSVQLHLKDEHPDWTMDQYRETYPVAEVLSDLAKEKLAQKMAARAALSPAPASTGTVVEFHAKTSAPTRKPMHEVFKLGDAKAALNKRGEPIMITVMGDSDHSDMVPSLDPNYVFNIDLTKTVIMGLELNIPTFLWGYHGTGKTSQIENTLACTNRPWVRVQHTINTEESHIVGQTLVRDGATYFEPGPLPLAMRYGLVYCADEYDFAPPSVTSVYQAVLEGKALMIKEAPPEWRVVKPHPNFRFVATGNTNGCGDESGLYQGTQLGNAANYSRFGITEEVGYMQPKIETAVVAGQSGVDLADAEKLVSFANQVREAFKAQRIGSTVSPREIINAAKLGLVRGSDWRAGLKLAFSNRLSRIDKETVEQMAQRIFGGAL